MRKQALVPPSHWEAAEEVGYAIDSATSTPETRLFA